MKKRLLFIVLIILTLSLSACNPGTPKENDVPDASASPETTEEPENLPAAVIDKSFNSLNGDRIESK